MGISEQDIFAVENQPGDESDDKTIPVLDIDPDPDPDEDQPPARSRRAWVAAAAGGVLFAGALAYALMVRSERDDANDQVGKLTDENRDLSDALALHRAGSIELDGKLKTCNSELAETASTAETKTARVVELESELTETRKAVATLEEKESELKSVTRQFQKMIDSGKLDVMFRRGQLIVKLPARILFASGSADVSDTGAKALAEVAAILKTMHRKFTVAGHTDNIPISTPFKNNWELSAARAVSVVAVLTKAGVRPASLVAAGFGPYAPIATNRTAAGRQINRRIEIILEPDLAPAVRAVARKKK